MIPTGSVARAIRFLAGIVLSPSKTIEKFEQRRLIKRGKRTFAASGLDRRLQGLMSEAFSPRYEDLIRLWDLVRENHPSLVLEYGSGCSTIVIAAALRQNQEEGKGAGKLLSVEGYDKWLSHTHSHLTEEEKRLVELREMHPDVVTRCLKVNRNGALVWYSIQEGSDVEQGIVGLVYPELHGLSPDIMYLDGPDPNSVPGFADAKGAVFAPIVFDPLEMEEHLPSNATIVIDGRPQNSMVLHNNFRTSWETEILGRQKCTILRRK